MINNRYKCIQVHIPKTGGISIRKNLFKVEKTDKLMHKTPIFPPYQTLWDSYYTFTFIRNPFDRLLSAFSFTIDENNPYSYNNRPFINEFRQNKITFKQFVISMETRILEDNPVKRKLAYRHPRFRSMKEWFIDKDGKPYTYDFIGRCENFTQDYLKLCNNLNVTSTTISKANKSTNRDSTYREHYTPEMIKIVEKLYEWDLNYFNYEF